MIRRMGYGIICGAFGDEGEDELRWILSHARGAFHELGVGIAMEPRATFDARVERIYALDYADHTFFYADEKALRRSLRELSGHVRVLEARWRERYAPGQELAELRYYLPAYPSRASATRLLEAAD